MHSSLMTLLISLTSNICLLNISLMSGRSGCSYCNWIVPVGCVSFCCEIDNYPQAAAPVPLAMSNPDY